MSRIQQEMGRSSLTRSDSELHRKEAKSNKEAKSRTTSNFESQKDESDDLRQEKKNVVIEKMKNSAPTTTVALINDSKKTGAGEERLSIASFDNQLAKKCNSTKAEVGVRIGKTEIITRELEVVTAEDKNISSIMERKNLEGINGYCKQPEIFIGVKDFFKFIKLNGVQELKSGFLLLRTKLGPMLAGNGYINSIRKASATSVNSVVSCVASATNHEDIDHWIFRTIRTRTMTNKPLSNLRKNSEDILRRYNETIQDQLRSGIIEEVHPDMDQEGVIHYLPHHERTKSLNEVLYRGPIMLPDLVGILLRFRMMKNAIIADVEKAFLQLELHQSDRNCTRFLWTNDVKFAVTEENLKCYRFRRVPFRVVSSPFLLAATLNHHLETIGSQTALEIWRNLYVDNVILSANGTREAINKYHEVKDIFKKTAMNIREFLSNDQNFNKAIPKQDRIEGGATKILGITWINDKDTIRVTLKPWIEHELTKRSVLQFVASQYDPLGFLVPTMIQFKLFLQNLWKRNNSWDQILDEDDKEA
uniref:Reverse transcriptase domain-containing protein n=1 Tax=Loa loa TaxID=7209 RepID=A0A1I7VAS5_LOALO